MPAKVGWDWLNERSLFFQFLFTRLERLINEKAPEESYSEYHLKAQGTAYEPFLNSISQTEKILSSFKKRLEPNTPFLVFTTHDDYPYFDAIANLCQKLEIPFVGHIPQEVAELDAKGMNTRSLDGAHWNELGHKVAAEHLACDLLEVLEDGKLEEGVLSFND